MFCGLRRRSTDNILPPSVPLKVTVIPFANFSENSQSINTSIFSNAILRKRPTECLSRFHAKSIAWVLIYLVVQLGKCCNINYWKIKDSSNCRKKIKWSRKMKWERNNLGGWNWRETENSSLKISSNKPLEGRVKCIQSLDRGWKQWYQAVSRVWEEVSRYLV